jgi:hypothetical protein
MIMRKGRGEDVYIYKCQYFTLSRKSLSNIYVIDLRHRLDNLLVHTLPVKTFRAHLSRSDT